MAISKAQQKAVQRYVQNNYDRIASITVPKGHKAKIQAHAKKQSESMNGFINRAIDETMRRDLAEGPQEAPQSRLGGGVVSLPSDTVKAAQEASEATGESVPEFVTRAVNAQTQRDRQLLKMGLNPISPK